MILIRQYQVYPYLIEPYIMQLELYIKYNDYDSAFKVINNVESMEFKDDRICLYKIKALIGTSNYDEARSNCMNEFDKALKIYDDMVLIDEDPTFPLMCKGKILSSLQYYGRAIEAFQEVKRNDPENSFVNGYIYEVYKEQNEINQALKYLDIQLEVAPSAYYYIEKGIIFADKEEFDEAKLCYEKALEIEPDNQYALKNLAILYYNKGEYEETIRYSEQALDYDEENEFYGCVERIVRCYVSLGKKDMAIEVSEKNIKDYNEVNLYSRIAELFYKEKMYEETVDIIDKIIYSGYFNINDVERSNYFVDMGECFEILDMYEKSIEAYSKAIKLHKKHFIAYERLAEVYAYLGDYKNAILYIKKQIEISPDDTTCLIKMGEILKLSGKSLRAKSYFKKALDEYKKCGEDDACTNNYIGRCLCGLGNIDDGEKYLNRAITLCSSCEECPHEECFEAYWGLGNILVTKGDYEEALKYFEMANEFKGESDIDVARAIRMLKKKMKGN